MKNFVFILLITGLRLASYAQDQGRLIDSLLNYMFNRDDFHGVVLAADKDSVVYDKAFGLANRDWNIQNTSDTKFRLGSVSKQFIGFVIIKLAEEGRLKPGDPLGKFLPAFDTDEKKHITIRNLLTHTSGIYDYTNMREFNSMVLYPQDSLVNMIASHQLNFIPSTYYSYSNSNFYLLTVIAEKVTGKKFEDVLQEKILDPAGMKNSGIEHNENILSNRAYPYMKAGPGFVNGEYIEMGNVAAGMYGTAGDLLQWSLFIQQQLRADTFLRASLQPSQLTDGTTNIYSAGWCLLPGRIMHQGHINGFANEILIDTQHNRTIIILSNDNFKELYVTAELINLILQRRPGALDIFMQKNFPDIDQYTGTYIHQGDTVVNKLNEGTLVSYFRGQALPWHPFLQDEFYTEFFEGNVKFGRNAKGIVDHVFSFENYNWIEWKKSE